MEAFRTTANKLQAFTPTVSLDFETLLNDISFDFGIPGNVTLTRTILKMQATINALEANQRLMQERITELEGAQELP